MAKSPTKIHYAAAPSGRASCGQRLTEESARATSQAEFWQAYRDGLLCRRCLASATNVASPY